MENVKKMPSSVVFIVRGHNLELLMYDSLCDLDIQLFSVVVVKQIKHRYPYTQAVNAILLQIKIRLDQVPQQRFQELVRLCHTHLNLVFLLCVGVIANKNYKFLVLGQTKYLKYVITFISCVMISFRLMVVSYCNITLFIH